MVRVNSLALTALSVLSSLVEGSKVLDLTPDNFDSAVFSGAPSLVEFFAPWCGHCKNLAPVYDELADSFSKDINNKKVVIAKVDADNHKDLGKKYGISGFPTLKWFDGVNKDPEDYTGGRDLESLQKFVKEKSGVKPKKKVTPPSDVKMLTDKTFSSVVGQDKDAFVAFTAPWCGHCKTLAPLWEKVANDYAPDNVIIGKLDAEANKKVAQDMDIKSYPTIKYFPAGDKKGEIYTKGRDHESFIEFINEKTGLHRLSGGGLDDDAGTVKQLDELVKGVSGASLADVQTKVEAAAKDIKGTAKEYYLKVLLKMKENEAYLEKEKLRISGLLEKGGLTRSKEDDMNRRMNVLNRFSGFGSFEKEEL